MPLTHTGKRLLGMILSPDQYDFWAQQLGSISSWERCFARIVSRKDEAENTVSFSLKPNANFPGFLPGQHVNLSATLAGRRITRSYSLTGLYNDLGLISLTVRKDPNGLMSQWLCEHAAIGSIVEINEVFGDMTLGVMNLNAEDELVLLAAGSGITPLISLLRDRLQRKHSGKTTLVYWERNTASFCFTTELNELCKSNSHIAVHYLTTRGPDADGRISEQQLRTLLTPASQAIDPKKPVVAICGSNDFVDSARQIMTPYARSLHAEAFSPQRVAPTTEQARNVVVELLKSKRTVTVSNQQTLLEALEQQGIAVESGCRMGICNTCSCDITSGKTQNAMTGLPNDGLATRLCISRAASDLQIDI